MTNPAQGLAAIIGQENVLTDQASLLACSASANFGAMPARSFPPLAIARPRHISQLAKTLAFCSENKIPIAIRGAGTFPGANSEPAASGGFILLMDGLSRIIDIDEGNRLAIAQAGATCQALRKEALERGLYLPCPTAPAIATIGGVLTMNATAGPKFGPIANHVDWLEAYSADGQRIHCASQESHLFAGFPLAPLFCGSSGCLGAIALCALRLLPAPECEKTLLASFASEASACAACAKIMRMPEIPARLEFFDKTCAAIILNRRDWRGCLLACAFQGQKSSVESFCAAARDIIASFGGALAQASNLAPQPRLLPALCANGQRFALQRLRAPVSRFAKLVEGIRNICESKGVIAALSGNAGCGAIQAALFYDDNEKAIAQTRKDLFALELMLNERLENETDADQTREQWQKAQAIAEISQRVRPIFDPAGILAAHPLPGAEQMSQ